MTSSIRVDYECSLIASAYVPEGNEFIFVRIWTHPPYIYLHNKIGNIYEQPNPWDILFVGNILWIKFSIGLTFLGRPTRCLTSWLWVMIMIIMPERVYIGLGLFAKQQLSLKSQFGVFLSDFRVYNLIQVCCENTQVKYYKCITCSLAWKWISRSVALDSLAATHFSNSSKERASMLSRYLNRGPVSCHWIRVVTQSALAPP